jgi:hypothetical protein
MKRFIVTIELVTHGDTTCDVAQSAVFNALQAGLKLRSSCSWNVGIVGMPDAPHPAPEPVGTLLAPSSRELDLKFN